MRCGNCRRDVSHMIHICAEINGVFYCSQECANKGHRKDPAAEVLNHFDAATVNMQAAERSIVSLLQHESTDKIKLRTAQSSLWKAMSDFQSAFKKAKP